MLSWFLAGCEQSASPGPRAQERSSSAAATQAAATAEQAAWFVECAQERGIRFQHDSGHRGDRYLFPECVCGGAALFDMDGDGDLDAYLVQSGNLTDPRSQRPANQLFRNRGDGTFEDVTAASGADDRGYGMGVAIGDYDNDGDPDLYITNVGPDVLLRNQGNGRFADVTQAAGIGDDDFGSSAAFVDVDADGHLDLFVVNYIYWTLSTDQRCFISSGEVDYCSPTSYKAPARCRLYRNQGDGTFADMSGASGVQDALGNGLGVVCADFNGDGRTDIFVANDGSPNHLWINQGNWRFENQAERLGVAVDTDGQLKAGMGVVAADVDDDGDDDLLVVNLDRETDSLYRNEGGYFVDATRACGLGSVSRQFTRFGVGLTDFDNDGRLDLFQANGRVRRHGQPYSDDPYAEPNVLMAGGSSGRFAEQLPRGGTMPMLIAASRAAAFGDIDGDGAIDVLIQNRDGPAHLLRNVAPDRGHWIMFRVLDEHGRDALGATVILTDGSRTQRRVVRSAFSYCAANDPRVHVGLGLATSVADVAVRWVDGTIEHFGDHPADRLISLRRGQGTSAAK